MLWTVTWLGDTRERFMTLVRERFARSAIPGDIGNLATTKVEDEICLHPIPSLDLPQIEENCEFRIGTVQVLYHIGSAQRQAEIREVHDAT
jgi:hypothetical protein